MTKGDVHGPAPCETSPIHMILQANACVFTLGDVEPAGNELAVLLRERARVAEAVSEPVGQRRRLQPVLRPELATVPPRVHPAQAQAVGEEVEAAMHATAYRVSGEDVNSGSL